MEPGNVLQHQALISSDYTIAPESECIDQYPAHSGHSTFTHDSPVDQYRRNGTIHQPAESAFPYSTTQGGRMFSEGGVASDATSSYPPGNLFPDTSSGAISSPASAGSAVAPNSYYGSESNTPGYTAFPRLSGAVVQPQAFTQGTYAGSRYPPVYENDPSSQSLHEPRSTFSDSASAIVPRASYTAPAYRPPHQSFSGFYGSYAQTPRLISTTSVAPFSPQYMADSHGPPSNMTRQTNDAPDMKFPKLESAAEIKCNGRVVDLEIHAKVEKGMFLAESNWTCYRRNYFSVQVSFELRDCNAINAALFVHHRGKDEQIQAFGMRLSAAVDGQGGKTIELIQHTPKRDHGPKTKIEIVKVAPSPSTGRADTMSPNHSYQIGQVGLHGFYATGAIPGPWLPFQHTPDTYSNQSESQQSDQQQVHGATGMQFPHLPMGNPTSNSTYTFERIQFKQATANNGKRRASQQYFHLIVELFADIRKPDSDEPKWVKVAHRTSDNIVVRGRSPSHYQNEGHNHGNRGGSGSSGSFGGSMGGIPGYGAMGSGFSGAPGQCLNSNAGPGAANYRHRAAADGHGSASPESEMEDPLDVGAGPSHLSHDSGRGALQSQSGYRYHPFPLYDEYRGPQLPKIETAGQPSTDPGRYAFRAEFPTAVPGAAFQANQLRDRFQSFPSSQGWFPEPPVSASPYT